MLHCLKLRQPSHIISHGWIITKEGKMSKSLGNVVDPYVLIDEYGADMLRYYLIKEIQIENDSVFDLNLFHETYNNDLANTFGNLVSRFHGMI
jgi:methionyl-tRNA synthetase